MKKTLLLLCLLFCIHSYSQSVKKELNYYGNAIHVSLERNNQDNFDAHITNLKSGDSKVIQIEKGKPVSSYMDQIYAKIIGLTPNLKIIIEPDVEIILPNLTHTYKDAIDTLTTAQYEKILKPKFTYVKNGKDFKTFTADLTTAGKPIFADTDEYKLKKSTGADGNTVELHNASGKIAVITDEAGLINAFFTNKGNPDFDKFILTSIELDKKSRSLLEDLYTEVSGKDEYCYVDNLRIAGENYQVKVKQDNNLKVFTLKVCNLSAKPEEISCVVNPYMNYNISYNDFKADFKSFNKITAEIPEHNLINIYNECAKFNNAALIAKQTKPLHDSLQSLVKRIEDLAPKFSGILKINKSIPVYKMAENWTLVKEMYDVIGSEKFEIEYATVRFFNNKGKHIVVVGNYNGKRFTIENYYHSVRLAAFNESNEFIPLARDVDEKDRFYLNYNDVFDYEPSENSHGSAIRNKDYRVEPEKSVKMEERRLADYFTAVIFSDFLGLNSENANALIQAEGRVKIPLWISNKYWLSVVPAISSDINVSIYNGFDDTSRSITPLNAPNGLAPVALDTLKINNFDYIKNNNLNAGISLDLINFEIQRLSTEFSFGYGVRYYRAGLKYNIESEGGDITKTYQLNALTHEFYGNFEIRPQVNFGADLNIGFNWINARGSVGDIPIEYNKDTNLDDRSVLRIQMNLYSKLDPDKSNDGIYARMGGFYHLGQKDFYPQILVGYATNLSSFINKFKKENNN